MTTEEIYIDKEGAQEQQFHRKDSDGTEGGSVFHQDVVQVDSFLELESPDQFRRISEVDGELTIEARMTQEETVILAEEVSSIVKPPADTSTVAEEFSASFGFGGGDFGQGGFGGTLP